MNRCPACGKVYGDEARFCTRDGSKLIALPSTPAARGTVAGRAEPPAELTHGNLSDRVLDGRYRILRKVGEGGMSFVYLASDIATQEQYAIKVLRGKRVTLRQMHSSNHDDQRLPFEHEQHVSCRKRRSASSPAMA